MIKNRTIVATNHFWVILCLVAMIYSCAPFSPSEERRPNILFIAVDDLRPELNCYGKKQIHSPNIDRLARSGVLLQRSYCNIPVCGASRASILTGLRPTRNRFLHYYTHIDSEAPGILTLPKHFKNHGYRTISNGKIAHNWKTDIPDSWDEVWHASSSGDWHDYLDPENLELMKTGKFAPWEKLEVNDTAYMDGRTAQKTIRDLQQLKDDDQPFFLACGFLKPHLPFNAPKTYWDLYPRDEIILPPNDTMPQDAPQAAQMNWGELRGYYKIPKTGPVSQDTAISLIHGYRACVSYIDAQIGKVLDELDRLELTENTVVILWGDHGWNLLEHGLWCKHCNFNTSLQTPMILAGPGILKDHQTKAITEYVDIYPTLCELAGLDQPGHLQGNSFADILKDEEAATDGLAICKWFDGVTLIRDNYFFTEWSDTSKQVYARMLFDHDTDPQEDLNIAELPEHQALLNELSSLLKEEWGNDFYTGERYDYGR